MSLSRVAVPCVNLSRNLLSSSNSNAVVASRWYSSKGQIHPGYQKIKKNYEKFQIDDGTPIHMKGGPLDKIMYYATLAGCGVGLLMCAEYYYSASFPKKPC